MKFSKIIVILFLSVVPLYIGFQHLITTGKVPAGIDKPIPIISVHIGATMENVRKASTFNFREPENMINPVYVTDKPNIFRYTQKGLEFTLPKAGYVFIVAAAEHITHIEVSPRSTYSSYEEVLSLINNLIEKFDNAGWKRDKKMNQLIPKSYPSVKHLSGFQLQNGGE